MVMQGYEVGDEFETDEYESDELYQGEYLGETDQGETDQFLGSIVGGLFGEVESPIGEVEEMELASQLLEITDEAELDQFLGGLFKKVAKGVGGIIKSPVGKALGGVLKSVAKKALPMAGAALGSMVAPGIGTALGGKLGSLASGLFEMELEGMDQEEAELEVARRYVRLAATAARRAAVAPRNAPPRVVVKNAIVTSAKQHAPGLLKGTPYYTPSGTYGGSQYRRGRSGRWVRRGRKIVLFGV